MKQFPHQQFMEDNKAEIAKLPPPELLQKRLAGFEEMQEDLEHTTDEDRTALEEKLELLSHEILEDLEDYYGEHLENNELEDEPGDEQEDKTENEPGKARIDTTENREPEVKEEPLPITEPKEKPEQVKEEAERPEEQNEAAEIYREEPEPVKEQVKPAQTIAKSDEEILHELHSAKKAQVYPAELRARGYKGNFHSRRIVVGRFCLTKGKYDTCYRITRDN